MRLFIFLLLLSVPLIHTSAQSIEKSVVKISVTKQQYDYNQPWQKSNQSKSSGSGCVIQGNRILTCAHVVEFGEFIEVKKTKDSRRYTASIEFLAPEYDLAVLKLDDESFFTRTKPLPIGDLPDIGKKVTVYGFPTGGNDLSVTSGIVSRIENIDFSYDNYNDLGIQIDAAINPGNSGGPVVMDTSLAGVAFQGKSSSQNIGYMIPTTVIKAFLKDIADSTYEGPVPVLIQWQNLENTALRKCFGIADTATGVLVNKVHYCSALAGAVQPDDILLSIDHKDIQNDGSVYINNDVKTSFETIIKNKNLDDTVALHILRQGLDTTIMLPLEYTRTKDLLVGKVDLEPKYYIQNGFVFTTPSYYYFQDESYWQYYYPQLSYYYYGKVLNTQEQQEIVMISSVLPDKSNVGYHDVSNRIVSKINGYEIRNFNDLIRAFDRKTDFYTIEDSEGNRYVLDATNLNENNNEIFRKYGITRQMRY
ncbi:MAG: serine protease [Chitinophagaceae bacterium]|nr:MAG: serine protease [Chitinophagaceae bacterium]